MQCIGLRVFAKQVLCRFYTFSVLFLFLLCITQHLTATGCACDVLLVSPPPLVVTHKHAQASDITYRLQQTPETEFFVDTDKGIIFGEFLKNGTFTIVVYAIDKGGKVDVAERYTFVVRNPSKFTVVAVGSNNRGVRTKPPSTEFTDYDAYAPFDTPPPPLAISYQPGMPEFLATSLYLWRFFSCQFQSCFQQW